MINTSRNSERSSSGSQSQLCSRLTKAPENDASPKQTVAGCPDVEIVLVIEVIVPTDGRLSHEPKTACREKTLAGASLVHADTSRLIQSSSTLGNSSGLCSKAYCREPNTAGR